MKNRPKKTSMYAIKIKDEVFFITQKQKDALLNELLQLNDWIK